jgi:hypothetical protein
VFFELAASETLMELNEVEVIGFIRRRLCSTPARIFSAVWICLAPRPAPITQPHLEARKYSERRWEMKRPINSSLRP